MELPLPQSKPDEATCAHCNKRFRRSRRDQIHCSSNCRKLHSQKARRQGNSVNSRSSPTKRRRDQEFFDVSLRLGERLYGLPVGERLGFMQTLIEEARSGNTALREILSNHYLLKANWEKPYLFHRECPATYFTIAQAADRYCRKFWRASVRAVVYGRAPEPPTGEVITTENVVTINNMGNKDEGAASSVLAMQDVITIRRANQEQLASFDCTVASEDDHPVWQSEWLDQDARLGLSNEGM